MSDPRSGSFDGLPEVLCEIAEIAGLEAAMKLAWEHGGTKVLFPRKVGPDHWLTKCVGRKAADAICAHYAVRDADGRVVGNFKIFIPQAGTGVVSQARKRLARELATGNLGVAKAARKCGLSERAGWRLKAKLRGSQDTDQGDLF